MLAELAIDDLVLIAAARIEFAPGLNVITGETGAGKTLLAQGIGLLLGEKGEEALVRPGAERALIQAVFDSDQGSFAVARRVTRGGRSRAYLEGVVSSAVAVEAALRDRVAFYGHLEQARLLQLERQIDLLDAAAGNELAAILDEYVEAYAAVRELTRRLDEVESAGRDREREVDLLRFQIDEIEAAALEPGEDQRLAVERDRLRHAGKLLERAGGALRLLAPDGEGGGLDALRAAGKLLAGAQSLDASLEPLAGRLAGLAAEAEDAVTALREYLEALDIDATRRDAVELRHDRLQTLRRKYGATAADILAHAAQAGDRLASLERLEADESELVALLAAARQTALAAAVAAELQGLAMPHVRFEVALQPRGEGLEALGPRGAEEVEFLFSANPGVPLRPLRETASGGELSRAMLAIKSIVHLGNDVETLIFDEVDTGIGGVTATALGERLAALAETTQVICITHLPQVAAFAGRHFVISKTSDPGAGTTETSVSVVDGDERLAELCRMLGADSSDEAARGHALNLLKRAAEHRG